MRPLSKKALLARPKLYFCPKCNTSRTLKPGEEKHYALPRGQGTADVVKYLSCGHPVNVETQESGATWRQFAGGKLKCERCGGGPAANTEGGRLCRNCRHEDWKKEQKAKKGYRKTAEEDCPDCGKSYCEDCRDWHCGCAQERSERAERKSRRKTAGPDAFGAGVSPMSGGGSAGGQGASGGQVNPSLMGAPPAATPTSTKPWRCPHPGCRRVLPSGRELRDHMWDEHEVRDVG